MILFWSSEKDSRHKRTYVWQERRKAGPFERSPSNSLGKAGGGARLVGGAGANLGMGVSGRGGDCCSCWSRSMFWFNWWSPFTSWAICFWVSVIYHIFTKFFPRFSPISDFVSDYSTSLSFLFNIIQLLPSRLSSDFSDLHLRPPSSNFHDLPFSSSPLLPSPYTWSPHDLRSCPSAHHILLMFVLMTLSTFLSIFPLSSYYKPISELLRLLVYKPYLLVVVLQFVNCVIIPQSTSLSQSLSCELSLSRTLLSLRTLSSCWLIVTSVSISDSDSDPEIKDTIRVWGRNTYVEAKSSRYNSISDSSPIHLRLSDSCLNTTLDMDTERRANFIASSKCSRVPKIWTRNQVRNILPIKRSVLCRVYVNVKFVAIWNI